MSDRLKILSGDCRETLKEIPAGSVQCCVTSPPYWGLRRYLSEGHPDAHREIGQEPTPEAYIATMVEVFREVRRVLHDSGTVFLNVGDSYTGSAQSGGLQSGKLEGPQNATQGVAMTKCGDGLKPKDLCLIPWRLAIALQADGWWVRSVIVWAKKSCMPESVTDRPTNSWEPIFLLAKSSRYFYDAEAVREPHETLTNPKYAAIDKTVIHWKDRPNNGEGSKQGFGHMGFSEGGRNQRNVWHLGPEPYAEAHFATFPTEIPRRAILAGTSARGCCPKCGAPWLRVVEKETVQGVHGGLRKRADAPGAEVSPTSVFRTGADTQTRTVGWEPGCECGDQPIPCTVLDPFGGSGTTGKVAIELGRNSILCELSTEYQKLIEKRTTTTVGLALF